MYINTTFPPDSDARLAAFLSGATMLGAKEIGMAVDALIAKLDALSGDSDLEEDDPSGGDITDEPHDCDGDEEDGNASEDDFMIHAYVGNDPGCPIADPGGFEASHGFRQQEEDDEDDAAALREPHLNRIRRTRCNQVRAGRYVTGYKLRSVPNPLVRLA
jgi:hypothetical protein